MHCFKVATLFAAICSLALWGCAPPGTGGLDDGPAGQTASINVQSGTAPAFLSFSGGSSFDYGTHEEGTTTDHTFTITNSGGMTATALGPPVWYYNDPSFHYKGGSYPGTGGTCGTSLAPQASCTIVITFKALPYTLTNTPSSYTSYFTLQYSNGATTQYLYLSLSGTTALLALTDCQGCDGGNPNPFDYGPRGLPADHTFYLKNYGAHAATSLGDGATLGDGFAFKGGAYPGDGGTCGTSLPQGALCTIVVTFTPPGSGNPPSSIVTINYNDGTLRQAATRAITGTATSRSFLKISECQDCSFSANPSPHDYGTRGVPGDSIFSVSNTGARTAVAIGDGKTLGNGFAFKGGAYPGIGGTCSTRLAPGATCIIVVTFTPAGSGASSSTITLGYQDGPSEEGASHGEGGGLTRTDVEGGGYDDPSTLKTATRAVTATSTSLALLKIFNCPDCDPGPNPSTYDFGTVGAYITRTFYLSNVGAQPATAVHDVPYNWGQAFGLKGGSYPGTGGTCGHSVAPGATCTIVMAVDPSWGSEMYGPASGDIGFDYNNGATHQQAYIHFLAFGTTLGALRITDGPDPGGLDSDPFDYGTTGLPQDHTFYVTNTGYGTATSLGNGATLGNGFAFKGGSYPGTGGTCGSSLASRATCTLVVTFTPSDDTSHGTSLTLPYVAGRYCYYWCGPPIIQTAVHGLTGTATSHAFLSVSDCPSCGAGSSTPLPADYGTTGIPEDRTFYVTNTGAQTATSMRDGHTLADGFAFKGHDYPGTGGTCGTSLAPGESCTVVVTFTPRGTGPRPGLLTIGYHDLSDRDRSDHDIGEHDEDSYQRATRALTGTANNPEPGEHETGE